MLNFSAEAFRHYIKSDNKESLAIYDDLAKALHASLKIFPKNQNIFGVYFFDILKFLTQTHLKCKEIKLGFAPTETHLLRNLESWPYVGYQEITEGVDIENKKFGKSVSIEPTFIKRIFEKSMNFQKNLRDHSLKKITMRDSRLDQGRNILSFQSKYLINLISAKKDWFRVPNLHEQLHFISSTIHDVVESNHHVMSPKILSQLLLNHIKANCGEGNIDLKLEGDVVVLQSGIELENRMLGMTALQQSIPVVNIVHGEAFGIQDEPIFGELGENFYSRAILGYGDGALRYQQDYKFGLTQNINYIKSNGVKVGNLFSPEFRGVHSSKKTINYVYFPTTLSGTSHRYGPYRDTSDHLYLLWQQKLHEIFKNRLIVKSHPKEKYYSSLNIPKSSELIGSIAQLLDKIDVFVFDYIGTAFNEACATNKPVIYFDLGIRNTAFNALQAIKARTIYFNLDEELPTLASIEEKLRFTSIKNDYSQKYSLCGNNQSRARALSEAIDTIDER